jgi:hypothetical protein
VRQYRRLVRVGERTPVLPDGLIPFALESLRGMQLPSGLFCEEVASGSDALRGVSLRYTAMVYLGLWKADAAGYGHSFDLDRIQSALLERVGAVELRPGDLGLYLWADARAGWGRRAELIYRLEQALEHAGGLRKLEGMELAWIVEGLLPDGTAAEPEGQGLLQEALALLLQDNVAPSGLLYHHGAPGFRRRFPNFATEIYGVLALSSAAKRGVGEEALAAACRTADVLLQLQLSDGAWPWLYEAERGQVVERYEIYSVHQHAMAPMGLLELEEATGDERYADAARHGLRWIEGKNELGVVMADPAARMIYRSIRRRRPLDRALLYANTAAARVAARTLTSSSGLVELNAVCRPYELGWLLEAWCGREAALRPTGQPDLAGGGSNQP